MSFRRGVRLGLDVGSVRIGVARCDPDGILAVPVTVVPRGDGDMRAIADLVTEHDAIEVLVGHPVTLRGEEGAAAQSVREFSEELLRYVTVPLRLVDERLSTVAAQRSLHDAGRNTRSSKSVIDAAAAAYMVQGAIEYEKKTSVPAGTILHTD